MNKATDAPLSCEELAKVAKEERYGKIQGGGTGGLDIAIGGGNGGQMMSLACLYSTVGGFDAQSVAQKFQDNKGAGEAMGYFFQVAKWDNGTTASLTLGQTGEFMHPNGIAYKHLAIASYENFLPELDKRFTSQGKQLDVIYPPVTLINNFPAVRLTTEGRDGQATAAFLAFMLDRPAQQKLADFGFRPANPQVDYRQSTSAKYFNNKMEVGDAPADSQALANLWRLLGQTPR